ncbi:uncharacterized protein UMAG_02198 [Mycosarcoma maydis]|uniref:N-acetyltransferase domain-containing protein n=1 Tax=Mycosarcoma maydis TaxID=5270 RepID=A0A0D1E178_MYCMD|nr:uncharacterized protein UMAG_02198 [Ustilago maydis 521]KIS69666.1 hypothetical protein UMAG_02198 [Ustilago maydis 521]|eukprot:XP_011388543.1 hypothetical protein UMAG_02198 [Ustilago maydis 521]
MSADSACQPTDIGDPEWSAFLLPSTPGSALATTTPSPSNCNQDASPSALSTALLSSQQTRPRERSSPKPKVANLLTLTELRKAAWSRIYSSGIKNGDAAISTIRVPTWKQFDTLMIKRHRFIAVDPRDNRTLGWIACFHPYPQWSVLYDDDLDSTAIDSAHGRQGRPAEVQIMVAEGERERGVGTLLVKAVVASLRADSRYSTIQASFFAENDAARKLFERCEFELVCTRTGAVRMLDGPQKGAWRDLITVEYRFSSLEEQSPQQYLPNSTRLPSNIDNDAIVDPNAVLKRPRLS